MTPTILCSVTIRGRRDVLLCRQRALQLGRLLRLPAREQIHLAAGTFAVACQVLPGRTDCQLHFQVDHKSLRVVVAPGPQNSPWLGQPLVQLLRPLPEKLPVTLEDLRFVLAQSPSEETVEALANLEQMNQEILALLHALQSGQERLESTAPHLASPAAA